MSPLRQEQEEQAEAAPETEMPRGLEAVEARGATSRAGADRMAVCGEGGRGATCGAGCRPRRRGGGGAIDSPAATPRGAKPC